MKKKMVIVISVLFVMYCIAVPISEFMSDLIAPLYVLSAFLFIFLQIKDKQFYKISWKLLALMLLSWGLADLVWFLSAHFFDADPEALIIITVLYFGANFFLLMVVGSYFLQNIKRWHRVKLSLDIGIMFIIILGISSGTVFSKMEQYHLSASDLFQLALYLISDLLILLICLVLVVSVEFRMIPKFLMIALVGIVIYISSDLLYAYELINHDYSPNSIVDIMFYVSFLLFVIAASDEDDEVARKKITAKFETPENLISNKLVIWISIIPLLLFLIGVLSVTHFAVIIGSIAIYQYIAALLQRTVVAEVLLSKRQYDNEMLEAIVEDRTKELKRANWEMHRALVTDNLTELKNRKHFLEYIAHQFKLTDNEFSVFYMNLNRFKLINDVHGHAMGDKVLKVIADRFKHNACKNCEYARIGGDEFGVVFKSVDTKEIETLAKKISDFIGEEIVIEQFKFHLSISIGIARYPKDAGNMDHLLQFANLALEHAKHYNINENFIFYSSHLVERIERRNYIELLLREADFNKDFELYYQPKFSAIGNELVGMEALLRWNHTKEGFISPGEFIPIAEETNLILPLSDWVFKEASRQIKRWNNTYGLELKMSMNVSPISLDSYNFIPDFKRLIDKYDLDPDWLELEITEHSAMSSATKMEEVFAAISNLGIDVSIDDFGTGYSSLNYLKRFDIHIIKIAKELIDNITNSTDDLMIVKAAIMMAQGMNLETIAEGVETVEQLELLRNLGCDAIQGFLLGRPVSWEDFEKKYLLNK